MQPTAEKIEAEKFQIIDEDIETTKEPIHPPPYRGIMEHKLINGLSAGSRPDRPYHARIFHLLSVR